MAGPASAAAPATPNAPPTKLRRDSLPAMTDSSRWLRPTGSAGSSGSGASVPCARMRLASAFDARVQVGVVDCGHCGLPGLAAAPNHCLDGRRVTALGFRSTLARGVRGVKAPSPGSMALAVSLADGRHRGRKRERAAAGPGCDRVACRDSRGGRSPLGLRTLRLPPRRAVLPDEAGRHLDWGFVDQPPLHAAGRQAGGARRRDVASRASVLPALAVGGVVVLAAAMAPVRWWCARPGLLRSCGSGSGSRSRASVEHGDVRPAAVDGCDLGAGTHSGRRATLGGGWRSVPRWVSACRTSSSSGCSPLLSCCRWW